ncbi:DUF742 domain-containing protein [Pseudonocardia sp. KRD291]|uniref:DUF742 domain-containing protein n=1 Tax=Pseudonocardia sp. KRD291 TaxID=2792007 RepID=UPI001C49D310|nr:DUF742 domain-containing protein [Pseudonocardia sp. KRD291]
MTSEVEMGRSETGRTGARFGAPARRAEHAPDPEAPHGCTPEESEPVDAEETALPTGARFGGQTRRQRKRAAKAVAEAEPVATPATPEPAAPAVPTGPPPELGRAWETTPMPRFVEDPDPAPVSAPAATRSVRPYVVTGGRTRSRMELRIETLVSSTGDTGNDVGERRSVLELCARPRSVSEVAALVRVPLGVARVLIGDLATEGRLRVHVGVDAGTGPDLALLDRVLSGLRRL